METVPFTADPSVTLAVVPTGAWPVTRVAEGETVRMTNEVPSFTTVPPAAGACGSVTPWTAPAPDPSKSTMIGVGSSITAYTLTWIVPAGGAMGTWASAIDGSASAKTAATKRSRDRHLGCIITMVLIFPP